MSLIELKTGPVFYATLFFTPPTADELRRRSLAAEREICTRSQRIEITKKTLKTDIFGRANWHILT